MANWTLASGPLLLGVLIILAKKLDWPAWTHYVLGVVAILFGLFLLI